MCQLYSLMCQQKMIHEQKNRNEHINRRKLLNKLVAACLQSSAQFFMLCICYRCHKIWLIFLVKYFFVVFVFVISSLVRMLYMVRTVISPNTNSPLNLNNKSIIIRYSNPYSHQHCEQHYLKETSISSGFCLFSQHEREEKRKLN